MGWLRDSMRQGRSPHRSFGSVARAALAHPGWPKDSRPQARSLSALFSKLDRGLELQWLADRPAVQKVLAEVVGAPPGRFEEIASSALATATDQVRRVLFDDLPYASPLDLTDEPLPPGLPTLVQVPRSWKRVWWLAPSGAGRSLVGSWLLARRLARYVAAADLGEAAAELEADPQSTNEAVFVEVWSPRPTAAAPPNRDAICVAAPFPPRESDGAWTVVTSPAPETYVRRLVAWAALRLPRDGKLVPVEAEDYLEAAAARGAIDGFGAAVGLVGLADQYGVRELERSGLPRIGARFVRDRFAELRRMGILDAAWLEEAATDALAELVKRLVTDDAESAWEEPRTRDDWMRLVPGEYEEALDADWLRASLAQSKGPSALQDVERALAELPPGPFRIVRSLEQAGLLRHKHGGERLLLSPRWLARHLVESAKTRIADGTAREWSEGLVSPHAAGSTLRALVTRLVLGDTSPLEDALELANDREPASVAALEAAVRAAGLAVLSGVEIAEDVVLALWDQQVGLLVELDDGPHPRLGYDDDAVEGEPLLAVGTFRLAALALSEALPAGRGLHHPVLRPWLDFTAPSHAATLDSIREVLRRLDPHTTPWVREAYALAHRWRALRDVGARWDDAEPRTPLPSLHALEWPHAVLSAVTAGETPPWRDLAGASDEAVRALLAIAAHERKSAADVAQTFWRSFAEDPASLGDDTPLSPSGPHARLFYAHALPAALELAFARNLVAAEQVPYEHLDEAAFRAALGARPDALAGVRTAWTAMPPEILRDALRTAAAAPDDLRTAWGRAPGVAFGALNDALDRNDTLAQALLFTAPPSATTAIAGLLEARLVGATWLRPERTVMTRRWLAARIAARAEGWRDAFELLWKIR
jgi:hypothetical protein